MNITIKDIARKAGVSINTVSRALNNKPDVNKLTRENILKIAERLRYTPIGWSKVYEFNESDQRCTLDCIDEWIDSMGKSRSNVDPDKIPWDALRTLIS